MMKNANRLLENTMYKIEKLKNSEKKVQNAITKQGKKQ